MWKQQNSYFNAEKFYYFKGHTGEIGLMGVKGEPGEKGDPGERGMKGPRGVKGEPVSSFHCELVRINKLFNVKTIFKTFILCICRVL